MITIDSIKQILLSDLPALPIYVKVCLTVFFFAVFLLFVVSVWREPSTVRELNPIESQSLEQGVVGFFKAQSKWATDPAYVFGDAKSIVYEFSTNPNKLRDIEAEIERRKREDNNWSYANRLSAAKSLVFALGLTPATTKRNDLFMQMPLPVSVGDDFSNRRNND